MQAHVRGAWENPLSVRELLRYRYLFEQMVRRELRQKYQGSALGVLWYLVNPVVLMGAYTVMFGLVLKSPFNLDHYPLFILVGIVVWTFFSQSLLSAAPSLIDQGALIRKARFPRETIPGAVVSVQLVIFLALLAIVGPVVIAVEGSLDVALLLLPLFVVCLYAFTLGLALCVAALHAYFRDVAPILAAMLLPWFFVTPIFYRASDFPGGDAHPWLEPLLRWANPAAPFIDAIRSVLYDGRGPGLATVGYVVAVAAVVLPAGLALFRRMQAELAVAL
jgi:ABC-type polysaccharide/polyol phosphate export permease